MEEKKQRPEVSTSFDADILDSTGIMLTIHRPLDNKIILSKFNAGTKAFCL